MFTSPRSNLSGFAIVCSWKAFAVFVLSCPFVKEKFVKMVMIAKTLNGLRKTLKKKLLRRRRKGSVQTFEPQNPISEAEIEGESNTVEEVSNII